MEQYCCVIHARVVYTKIQYDAESSNLSKAVWGDPVYLPLTKEKLFVENEM